MIHFGDVTPQCSIATWLRNYGSKLISQLWRINPGDKENRGIPRSPNSCYWDSWTKQNWKQGISVVFIFCAYSWLVVAALSFWGCPELDRNNCCHQLVMSTPGAGMESLVSPLSTSDSSTNVFALLTQSLKIVGRALYWEVRRHGLSPSSVTVCRETLVKSVEDSVFLSIKWMITNTSKAAG